MAKQVTRRNFTPVPFKLVANSLPTDSYHKRLFTPPRAYYQEMLKSLADAKRGTVACLETKKPYPQIVKAAAKLGYEVHYAEEGGKLFLQILSTGKDK